MKIKVLSIPATTYSLFQYFIPPFFQLYDVAAPLNRHGWCPLTLSAGNLGNRNEQIKKL
jgi:hypothetical protein